MLPSIDFADESTLNDETFDKIDDAYAASQKAASLIIGGSMLGVLLFAIICVVLVACAKRGGL